MKTFINTLKNVLSVDNSAFHVYTIQTAHNLKNIIAFI